MVVVHTLCLYHDIIYTHHDIMMSVMTKHTYIMTTEYTNIMTVDKPAKDPNALKIASFRTKEGVWAEFCQKAELIGLTATDVIKAAMEQFIAGEYTPSSVKTLVRHDNHTDNVLTRDEIVDIVNTAINTAISTEQINSSVMTVISTLSLPSHDDVSTTVNTAFDQFTEELARLDAEVEEVKKPLAIG